MTCSAVLRVRSPRTGPSWTAASTRCPGRKPRPGTPARHARPARDDPEAFWTTVGQAAPSPNPPLAYTAAETPTHPPTPPLTLHRGRAARVPVPGPRPAARAQVHGPAPLHGIVRRFLSHPLPSSPPW